MSINGSNPACEDLFQGDIIGKPSLLSTPCLTNLRGRKGLFPASHCIKLVAQSTGTFQFLFFLMKMKFSFEGPDPIQYFYRTCGRDEVNDNRIIHANHCGYVKLDWIDKKRKFRGCLHICDKDACNRTSTYSKSFILLTIHMFSLILIYIFFS